MVPRHPADKARSLASWRRDVLEDSHEAAECHKEWAVGVQAWASSSASREVAAPSLEPSSGGLACPDALAEEVRTEHPEQQARAVPAVPLFLPAKGQRALLLAAAARRARQQLQGL